MAPKRLLEKPPPADSSSEDESETDPEEEVEEENGNRNGVVEGADDDGDEEEEEEKVKSPVKKPMVSKPNYSGSGSDTELDSTPPSPSLSGFTIKPIASKPMDEDDSSVKPKAKNQVARPNKCASEEGAPPPESEPSEKDLKSKKKRKVAAYASASVASNDGGGEEEESKKSSSAGGARLWSEEDEIAVLKGMIDYKAKKGSDPNADMVAFHEFIKKSLNADVSKNQLAEKIRRLKKKYLNNAAKGENDEDPVFSKPHELKSFELSKKIWKIGASKNPNGNAVEENGSKSNNSKKKPAPVPSTPRSKSTTTTVLALPNKEMSVKKEKKKGEKVQANGKMKVEKEEEEEEVIEEEEQQEQQQQQEEDLWGKYPYLSKSLKLMNFYSGFEHLVDDMKEVMPLMESSKVKKLEKKWKELKAEEMELYVRTTGLIHEQAKLVLDAMKSE